MLNRFYHLLAVGILVLSVGTGTTQSEEQLSAPPVSYEDVLAAAIATVEEVTTDPIQVELAGPDARFSLLVSGRTKDNRTIDLTHAAKYKSDDEKVVTVDRLGVLRAVADGETRIHVSVAGKELIVPVHTSRTTVAPSYSFVGDIEPMLSRFTCNTSGCHGKAEGQNGFKLSVFGFDPKSDYQALVMEARGRRIFLADAERSLVLGKASGRIPHGGGVRIRFDSTEYHMLKNWIAAGAPYGGEEVPQVTKVEVTPRESVARAHERQQLRAIATYSDGRQVDVTHLARFQANNALAAVDETGLVTFGDVPGQAAVMATFAGSVDTFQVLLPRPEPLQAAAPPVENNFIDHLIQSRLARLNIAPAEPGTDADFLRRIYLDIIGRLPTSAEARTFLSDNSPGKRVKLVDELLARPEYADYWALVWSDLLRVERDKLGHKGAFAYYRWIRDSFAQNKKLDVWTRELLTAEGPLSETPQGYFYKVSNRPGEMAATVSQVFLGVRISCAECHHHPWDRWGQDDYYGMQAFFQQVQFKKGPRDEDLLFAAGNPQVSQPRSGEIIHPYLLGRTKPAESAEWMAADRRKQLATELTAPQNKLFAQSMANRYFAHFMGQGLVEPVDDIRDTNPSQNPELLAALGQALVDSGYDAQALIRLITSSAAYQRSATPNESNASDEQNFSRALFRRVPAEVLHDAISDTTGVKDKFDGVPGEPRAVQLWDSRVSHQFLKLFGRPMRTTACQCERVVEPSMAQVLHLMNSPRVAEKLAHPAGRVAELSAQFTDNSQLAEELYLNFFSRFPTAEEKQRASEYLATAGPEGRQAAAEDLAWSMLNSIEFVFNH